MIIAVTASACVGFFISGLIVVTLMDVIGYELSLIAMIKFVRRENNGQRYRVEETIGRQAVAINIQARIILTLSAYLAVAGVMLFICLKVNVSLVSTLLFAANVGLLIRCGCAILNEFCVWPFILRYDGFDVKEGVHLKKLILDEGDEPNAEVTLGLDEATIIDEDVNIGEIIVLLIPPTGGDMLYERMF